MGYLLAAIFLIVVVPLAFLLMSRRPAGGGGSRDHGMTVSEPSADQPTPGRGTNEAKPGAERRIPPG